MSVRNVRMHDLSTLLWWCDINKTWPATFEYNVVLLYFTQKSAYVTSIAVTWVNRETVFDVRCGRWTLNTNLLRRNSLRLVCHWLSPDVSMQPSLLLLWVTLPIAFSIAAFISSQPLLVVLIFSSSSSNCSSGSICYCSSCCTTSPQRPHVTTRPCVSRQYVAAVARNVAVAHIQVFQKRTPSLFFAITSANVNRF